MGSLSLLQGIFLTQGSNPGLPHCRCILYQLSHQGSPIYSRVYASIPICQFISPPLIEITVLFNPHKDSVEKAPLHLREESQED